MFIIEQEPSSHRITSQEALDTRHTTRLANEWEFPSCPALREYVE